MDMSSLLAQLEKKRAGIGISITTYKCPKCQDTGHIIHRDGFVISVEDCECEIRRRNEKRIERSGLSDLLGKYTFDKYLTKNDKAAAIKAAAERYADSEGGEWFVITGRPGSGKTHICTAIIGRLIEKGLDCRYMLWRDAVRELKALVNDAESYREKMDTFKRAEVLYIDDFLKGTVTDADINVAFELLNFRYIQNKKTIISGERSIAEVLKLDEAVGSRIYERSKGYLIQSAADNWRLQ